MKKLGIVLSGMTLMFAMFAFPLALPVNANGTVSKQEPGTGYDPCTCVCIPLPGDKQFCLCLCGK